MTCKELMTPAPVCGAPGDPVTRIAQLMKTEDIGSVPICEGRGGTRLAGIVTDRDLALKVVARGHDPNEITAGQVMTEDPVTCHAEDDAQSAMEAMEQHQVRRIPVIDDNGQLVGIIAQADVAMRCDRPEKVAEVVEEISRPALAA